MKKILGLLGLLVPFFFLSCDNTEEITGKITATIDGKAHTFPMATFKKQGEKTYIVSTDTDVAKSISIVFKGDKVGKYPLGLGTDIVEAMLHIDRLTNLDNIDNAFLYYPTGNIDGAFVSIIGELNITEYSSTKVAGTFTGTGVTKSFFSLGIDSIKANMKPFTGSFTAKSFGGK